VTDSYLAQSQRFSPFIGHVRSTNNENADDEKGEILKRIDGIEKIPRLLSYGLKNRSPPSSRKALGSCNKNNATVFVCENCGTEEVQWVGRCPTCRKWNTVKEHIVRRDGQSISERASFSHTSSWVISEEEGKFPRVSEIAVNAVRESRIELPNSNEVSRVLGGGLVPGSMIMIGGDPGVGKSTLLLQLACNLAGKIENISSDSKNEKLSKNIVVYISGEESTNQIASRAHRIGQKNSKLLLLAETDINLICNSLKIMNPLPTLVIIDSVQTMMCSNISSSPGSHTQVRESASILLRLAKTTDIAVILIGHVTKSGDIAGPKTVEHMVDTVLYLEGDIINSHRILRSVKNRFGSSKEIGVFEMTQSGMEEVLDPSLLFTSNAMNSEREMKDVLIPDGSAITVSIEGSRPILCEIQVTL